MARLPVDRVAPALDVTVVLMMRQGALPAAEARACCITLEGTGHTWVLKAPPSARPELLEFPLYTRLLNGLRLALSPVQAAAWADALATRDLATLRQLAAADLGVVAHWDQVIARHAGHVMPAPAPDSCARRAAKRRGTALALGRRR